MSIIFFRFFLLFSVVANMAGSKTRSHRACSRSLTSLVLSRSLRFAAKILYEIMLDRIFCNFSFFFTQFFWLMGWVWELFWRFLRFQLLFSRIFSGFCFVFGGFFKSFMDYSSTRACLLCYQPMAIVHYANLVLLNKYTFLTEGRYARPGHRWRTRTLLQAHNETV